MSSWVFEGTVTHAHLEKDALVRGEFLGGVCLSLELMACTRDGAK